LEQWEKGTPDGEMCGGSALTAYEIGEMGRWKILTSIVTKSIFNFM
jgi:hypothetical protein